MDGSEKHLEDDLENVQHRRTLRAEKGNGKRDEQRHEQYLEQVAGDKRADHGRGDDVEQEVGRAEVLGGLQIILPGFCIELERVDIKARAGLKKVDDRESD